MKESLRLQHTQLFSLFDIAKTIRIVISA